MLLLTTTQMCLMVNITYQRTFITYSKEIIINLLINKTTKITSDDILRDGCEKEERFVGRGIQQAHETRDRDETSTIVTRGT